MLDSLEDKLTEVVEGYLEDYAFEDLLEDFDITPAQAFIVLYNEGLIDETLLEGWLTAE